MGKNNHDTSLLNRYFQQGWLDRRYYDGKAYLQPFSANDRLLAGEMLYADFLHWKKGVRLVQNYGALKVDSPLPMNGTLCFSYETERFRRAVRGISKSYLPVVYKIVLDEAEIRPPKAFGARERLYFNDEIKGLLCRGLDELCRFYASRRE
jgi:hypothetical protein